MEKYSNHTTKPGETAPPVNGRTVGKSVAAIVVGVLSTIYILNPTAGFDFIPDFIPGIGNLDEATAVLLLMGCLRYFGFDILSLLKFLPTADQRPVNNGPRAEKVVSPADPEVDSAREAMFAGKR